MRWFALGCCLILLSLSAPTSSAAQGERLRAPGITFGANGGWFVVGGSDFGGTDDAWGLEGYAGHRTPVAVEVNLGVHYSSHGVTPTRDLEVLGIYVEPRKYFTSSGSGFVPWVGGRIGWARRDAGSGFSSTGYGLGVAGGSVLELSALVQLEALVSFNLLSFSPIFGASRDSGHTVGLQTGVRLLTLRSDR